MMEIKILISILLTIIVAVHCKPIAIDADITNGDVFRSILKANHPPSLGDKVGESDLDLFEGDIKKGKHFNQEMKAMQKGVARDVLKFSQWLDGKVPYIFRDGVSDKMKSTVQEAIQEFSLKTCVRFVPRTEEQDYIEFIADGGCWSYVGRNGGPQLISLGQGCEYKGIAIHEMMHAIGFWHEQARLDRDQYVQIITENIYEGTEVNFQKYRVGWSDTYGQPYDKKSIMHYGSYAFSKNGKKTIISLSDPNEKLGQRDEMTATDIKQINMHYGCDAGDTTPPPSTTAPPTTTQEPFTTPAPVVITATAAPGECKDTVSFCARINTSYCTVAWVKDNCKQRCLLCPKKDCSDTEEACPMWAKQQYCENTTYGTWMKKNCPRSCGSC